MRIMRGSCEDHVPTRRIRANCALGARNADIAEQSRAQTAAPPVYIVHAVHMWGVHCVSTSEVQRARGLIALFEWPFVVGESLAPAAALRASASTACFSRRARHALVQQPASPLEVADALVDDESGAWSACLLRRAHHLPCTTAGNAARNRRHTGR